MMMKIISISLLSFLIAYGNCTDTAAENKIPSTTTGTFTTFADWCRHQDSLPTTVQHTVDVLLEIADTQDCDQAEEKLTSRTSLRLNDNQIVDVAPLASLTNLTSLDLSDNQIVDISPLAGLTNLRVLWLWNNAIVDASPLADLTDTNLYRLYLGANPLSDCVCPIQPDQSCEYENPITLCRFSDPEDPWLNR